MLTRLLVVEDYRDMRNALQRTLRAHGFEVDAVASGEEAWRELERTRYDLVLCDLFMKKMSGLDLFENLSRLPKRPAFVLMSGQRTILQTVSKAERDLHVLHKTFDQEEVVAMIHRALEVSKLRAPQRRSAESTFPLAGHPKLQRAARTMETILIAGEPGVGKSSLARQIHSESSRRGERRFEQIGCRLDEALATSLLLGTGSEGARDVDGVTVDIRGGTLIIDEVGDLPRATQAVLLDALSRTDRPDVRIVATTARDLDAEVEAGRFDASLLRRLRVVELRVPPLRERPEDIPALLESLRLRVASEHGRAPIFFSKAARDGLTAYPWPGNIRELEHLIRRLSATEDPRIAIEPKAIGAPIFETRRPAAPVPPPRSSEPGPPPFCFEERDDLPSLAACAGHLRRQLAVLEYRQMILTLREVDNNESAAARRLKYPRATFVSRLNNFEGEFGAWPPR